MKNINMVIGAATWMRSIEDIKLTTTNPAKNATMEVTLDETYAATQDTIYDENEFIFDI